MAIDYDRLLTALKKAKDAAQKASDASDDRGTCNNDSVVLRLKGARSNRVERTLSLAGLSGYKVNWLGIGYMIIPPCDGMANKRNAAMEAMYDSLKADGYDVNAFYQMD